jgi:hypothetical protein
LSSRAAYQQLDDLYTDSSISNSRANSLCWFRAGTYSTSGIELTNPGTADERIEFNEGDFRCIAWIAYPGDTRPVLDLGYTGSGTAPRLRLAGSKIHFEGFHVTNGYVMALQLDRRNQYGAYVVNNIFDELNFFSEGSNQAFVESPAIGGDVTSRGTVIASNEFSNVGNEEVANAIKIYSEQDLLIEGNYFHDQDKPVELKDEAVAFTVRNNRFVDPWLAIGGNLADNPPTQANSTHGDICYNFIRAEGTARCEEGAMRLSDNRPDGDATGPIHVYRNTILGRIHLPGMLTAAGPHHFEKNVILNDGDGETVPYMFDSGTFDPSRIVCDADNLNADFDDSRVDDTTGLLSGGWAVYAGQRGHLLN